MLEAESGFAKGSPLLSQDGGAGLALRPRPVPPNPERPLLVQGPQRRSGNAPASRAAGPESAPAGPLQGTREGCVRSACRPIRAVRGRSAPAPRGPHVYTRSSQRQTQRSVAETDTP